MYEGKLVRLREHRMEEVKTLLRWMNDLDTANRLRGGGPMPFTLAQETAWMENNTGNKDNMYHFAVETLDGTLIGGCSYFDLDWRNRRCMVGWYIGEPSMRGKGYGTDMIETLLKILYTELGMQKVTLKVFGYNTDAVRLYERLGFVREGTSRRNVFHLDRWWDDYQYSMLREEWDDRG